MFGDIQLAAHFIAQLRSAALAPSEIVLAEG